ncbi:MAG: hypothetical protein ACXWM7_06040, partial [Parachlamydiaceae bacterium]
MTQPAPLSDFELLAYNQIGLIPAPDETEETFCARVTQCLSLKEQIVHDQTLQLPFKPSFEKAEKVLEEAYPTTQLLYDIQPSWVPIFFSNHQLAPWHGGCAWIFQFQTEGPRTAFLQLRKAFARQKTYLNIYPREELVAHEMAHIGRMMFNEKQFEEIVAYRTSASRWRKWLGPLVQSAFESLFFMIFLLAIFFLDSYLLVMHHFEAYLSLVWLKLLPLGLLCLALLRLWKRHRVFQRCRNQLISILNSPTFADHVLYRLSDKE